MAPTPALNIPVTATFAPTIVGTPTWVSTPNLAIPVPITSPIHSSAAVAYDEARHRLTTFGGKLYEPTRFPATTWVWDDTGWKLLKPDHSPSGRVGASMVYDSARHELVMFGGNISTDTAFNDTWIWDGEGWTQAQPSYAPSPRNGPSLVYDAARQKVVLFGGIARGANGQNLYLNDTWI